MQRRWPLSRARSMRHHLLRHVERLRRRPQRGADRPGLLRFQRDKVVIATKAGYNSWDRAPDFSPAAIEASAEKSLARLRIGLCRSLPTAQSACRGTAGGCLARDARPAASGGQDPRLGCFGQEPGRGDRGARRIRGAGRAGQLQHDGRADHRQRPPARGTSVAAQASSGARRFASASCRARSGATRRSRRAITGSAGRARSSTTGSTARATCWRQSAPGRERRARRAALRFCLALSAISTIIPGILTPEEAEQNAAASDIGPLPAEAVTAVLEINRRRQFFVRAARAQP